MRYILPVILILCASCISAPELGEQIRMDKKPSAPDPELPDYPEIPAEFNTLPVSSFGEIWGYLINGQEEGLSSGYPLTDIGYFGAEVDSYGRLSDVPDPQKIGFFSGRTHLVVACNSRGLTHFVIEDGSKARERLVADLLAAVEPFDGLQIDFELVPRNDGEAFRRFLRELRNGLGGKLLTAALPARTKELENDVYDYRQILPLVDRILVMAYDEHWATSEPGPIASMDWCRSVAAYALETLGPGKLIMGLPFYGRTWGSVNPNRAFFHSGIERIKRENNVDTVSRRDGVPTFTYEVPVSVTVFYEDEYSLATRLSMYRTMGVRSVGFWAMGQETPLVWELLRLEAK
ncbi:MAG: glycoside hydrolase [Treponema sp.]|jgi:spore germination protein YaaH|nr:glycoside hydrolase [Treponema sp.]